MDHGDGGRATSVSAPTATAAQRPPPLAESAQPRVGPGLVHIEASASARRERRVLKMAQSAGPSCLPACLPAYNV